MPNVYANLPATGVPTLTDTMAAEKTIVATAIGPNDKIAIEAAPDGITFDSVAQFSGQSGVRTVNVLALAMRVRKIAGGTASIVNVGADESCVCQNPLPPL